MSFNYASARISIRPPIDVEELIRPCQVYGSRCRNRSLAESRPALMEERKERKREKVGGLKNRN